MNNLLDKYDAVEWQSFSQKKDIEAIVRNTKEKKNIQLICNDLLSSTN